MYYPCSENKGADQLRGYREADLRLVFAYAKSRFSHDAAHLILAASTYHNVGFTSGSFSWVGKYGFKTFVRWNYKKYFVDSMKMRKAMCCKGGILDWT